MDRLLPRRHTTLYHLPLLISRGRWQGGEQATAASSLQLIAEALQSSEQLHACMQDRHSDNPQCMSLALQAGCTWRMSFCNGENIQTFWVHTGAWCILYVSCMHGHCTCTYSTSF